jgi:membrane-associated phospholipid phosphatase
MGDNLLLSFIDIVGFYGPQILFILSIFLLYDKYITLCIFLSGFFLNMIINIILKYLLKEPRPNEDKRLFQLQVNSGKYINLNRYGMPSGHAQNVFYATLFIYYIFRDKWITSFYLFISFITLYQRVYYKFHSLNQVFWGSVIGLLVGFGFYVLNKRILKGYQHIKPDDNAPL